MPIVSTRRPIARLLLAALAWTILAGSATPARANGRIRDHFRNFYGQDFYDHQHARDTPSRGIHRQYDAGYYGPAMIYGRQYGDEYGTIRDRAFVPARFNGVNGPGGENVPR